MDMVVMAEGLVGFIEGLERRLWDERDLPLK